MYREEQHRQWKKREEDERLAWEVKEERRCNDPKTWQLKHLSPYSCFGN
jgi:hypothetical protein